MTKDKMMAMLEAEFAITARVLKAFPADKIDWKPHELSRSAKEIMQTFITEGDSMIQMCDGILDFTIISKVDLPTAEDMIVAFEGKATQIIDKVKATPEEELEKDMQFFGMTGSRLEAIMFLLHDHIHHRGQFSVYIRMAGGKIPSIYGPTADEPMNQS